MKSLLFLLPLLVQAGERLPSGLELQLPAGWKLTAAGSGALIVPPAHNAEAEIYIAGVDPDLQSVDYPTLLPGLLAKYFPAIEPTPAGAPQAFQAAGGRGMLHSYNARSGNAPARINLYLVRLGNHGVGVLAAIGKPEPLARRSDELLALAASFQGQLSTPPAAPQVSNIWTRRLTNTKLVQFHGYSSGGNSGGMQSEKKLYLAGDGTFAFRASSSVSMNVPGANGSSAGRSQDGGRWRVVEQGGQSILELVSNQGVTEKMTLSMNGTQTLLNGRRWFVVGINE